MLPNSELDQDPRKSQTGKLSKYYLFKLRITVT